MPCLRRGFVLVAIVASAPIATSLAAPPTKSTEADAGTGRPDVDAGRDAGPPATIATPAEGSLEYLIQMALRLAQEEDSHGQRIVLLERQRSVLLVRRNQTIEAIRKEEAKAATLPENERAGSYARIARLRAELDAIDREIAALQTRLAQERSAERAAQEERARVQALIDARRRPTVKTALPPLRPSPVPALTATVVPSPTAK